MAILLNVQSSANIDSSASRAVSKAFVDAYVKKHPGTKVEDVDLIRNPPNHLGVDHIGAFFAPPEAHTNENKAALKASDAYVDQLIKADVVVLGTPMYNFGVASVMKSWVDNIVRVGRTFKYDATGTPVGLLPKKKVVIVVASGGAYSEDPMINFEHAGTYLSSIFGFLGMTDISVIRVERLAFGPEVAAKSIADAKLQAAAAA